MDSNGNVKYRMLPVEEWERLREIYPEDMPLPNPMVAGVAVAEKDGKIVGCWFMQLQWHMEPLIIKEHQADYKELAAVLRSGVPKTNLFYACAPNDKMCHVAEAVGMIPVKEQLYVGQGGA